jgi:hypothetical protein
MVKAAIDAAARFAKHLNRTDGRGNGRRTALAGQTEMTWKNTSILHRLIVFLTHIHFLSGII